MCSAGEKPIPIHPRILEAFKTKDNEHAFQEYCVIFLQGNFLEFIFTREFCEIITMRDCLLLLSIRLKVIKNAALHVLAKTMSISKKPIIEKCFRLP